MLATKLAIGVLVPKGVFETEPVGYGIEVLAGTA